MPETIFSNEELNELLVVLNIALNDSEVAIDLLRESAELDVYRQHQQNVRKWIRRFSAMITKQETQQGSESEATFHNLEKPWLPIQPGEEF